MATITGLSGSRYYVNNPIWLTVDLTGDAVTDSFTMTIIISGETMFTSKFYTYDNIAYIDVAEIVKGLLPEPQHPTNILSGQTITSNSVTAQINVAGFSISTNFYRGGEDSQRTNIQLPANAVLSESNNIPVWDGYPYAKYYLNSENDIVYSNILSPSETEKRRAVSCNPVYLRFLNTKGGYSNWLFDEWEIKKKTKGTDIIERRTQDLDLGLEATHTLSVSTRAEQRYTETLRALAVSPEISIYRIDNIVKEYNTAFQTTTLWSRIYNSGNNLEWNNSDTVNEFDFNFDLRFKNNGTLLW